MEWQGVGRGEFTQFRELTEVKCTYYLLYARDGFNDIIYINSFNHQSNAEGDIQLLQLKNWRTSKNVQRQSYKVLDLGYMSDNLTPESVPYVTICANIG